MGNISAGIMARIKPNLMKTDMDKVEQQADDVQCQLAHLLESLSNLDIQKGMQKGATSSE